MPNFAECKTKSLSVLSDFNAFGNLTMEQQLQLTSTLWLKPIASPLDVHSKTRSPCHAASSMFYLMAFKHLPQMKAQNIPLEKSIPSMVSSNTLLYLLWCVTLATWRDINIDLCLCLFGHIVFSQVEIKCYTIRIRIGMKVGAQSLGYSPKSWYHDRD